MGEKLFINWTTKFQDTMTKIYKDENIVTGNKNKKQKNKTIFGIPYTRTFIKDLRPQRVNGVSLHRHSICFTWFQDFRTQNPSDFTSAGSIRNGLNGKGEGGQVISYYNLIIN